MNKYEMNNENISSSKYRDCSVKANLFIIINFRSFNLYSGQPKFQIHIKSSVTVMCFIYIHTNNNA